MNIFAHLYIYKSSTGRGAGGRRTLGEGVDDGAVGELVRLQPLRDHRREPAEGRHNLVSERMIRRCEAARVQRGGLLSLAAPLDGLLGVAVRATLYASVHDHRVGQ